MPVPDPYPDPDPIPVPAPDPDPDPDPVPPVPEPQPVPSPRPPMPNPEPPAREIISPDGSRVIRIVGGERNAVLLDRSGRMIKELASRVQDARFTTSSGELQIVLTVRLMSNGRWVNRTLRFDKDGRSVGANTPPRQPETPPWNPWGNQPASYN
ncbi:MAG: hypothetical protein HY078_05430 [Elusimicrobia bacterium]|nr:hypothetical protein [Elusimicrobiota bacterium]